MNLHKYDVSNVPDHKPIFCPVTRREVRSGDDTGDLPDFSGVPGVIAIWSYAVFDFVTVLNSEYSFLEDAWESYEYTEADPEEIVENFLKQHCEKLPTEMALVTAGGYTCGDDLDLVLMEIPQSSVDPIIAERDLLSAEMDKLIAERDKAERAADLMASVLLEEDIDWSLRDRKWSEAIGKAATLQAELNDIAATLRMVYEADMRAIKLWQEAHPGNDLVWPDRTQLVSWLLEQMPDHENA